MRVMILGPPPDGCGGLSTLSRIAGEALSSRGYDVCHVALLQGFGGISEQPYGSLVRAPRILQQKLGLSLPDDWKTRWPCDAILATGSKYAIKPAREGAPIVVWEGTTFFSEYQSVRIIEAMVESRSMGVSFLINKLFSRMNAALMGEVLHNASKIIALSNYTAEQIAAEYGITSPKVEVSLFPVTPQRSSPRSAPSSEPTLLTVSRLSDSRKNIPLLLDAFEIVHERLPKSRLQLMGPFRGRSRLRRRIQGQTGVELLGYKKPEEFRAIYQEADLFVLSSRQEGLAIVICDALAHAIPVVSTRCGGPEDLLTARGAGKLTEHTPSSMADAIIEFLTDEDAYQRSSAAAVETVVNELNFDTFANRLGRALEEATSSSAV